MKRSIPEMSSNTIGPTCVTRVTRRWPRAPRLIRYDLMSENESSSGSSRVERETEIFCLARSIAPPVTANRSLETSTTRRMNPTDAASTPAAICPYERASIPPTTHTMTIARTPAARRRNRANEFTDMRTTCGVTRASSLIGGVGGCRRRRRSPISPFHRRRQTPTITAPRGAGGTPFSAVTGPIPP